MIHTPSQTFSPSPFPRVPEWDFANTTQIISPVDNPSGKGLYGKTNNHLDRITRIHPKSAQEQQQESHREVIWLTGIMHRNPFGMIDFYDTFNKKYGATFTFFDNPKATFNINLIADQVVDYLEQIVERDEKKEIILCAASAGEMLARRVYQRLNAPDRQHILDRIMHHISVCGISTYNELSVPQKATIGLAHSQYGASIGKKVSQILAKKINTPDDTGLLKIAGDMFLAPVTPINADILEIAWKDRHPEFIQDSTKPSVGMHENSLHRKRGAISLTEAHKAIFETIRYEDVAPSGLKTPPATMLWSSNDRGMNGVYADPEKNAEKAGGFYGHRASTQMIPTGGHVDVVFQSKKYLKPMEEVLSTFWNQEASAQ